CVSVIIWQVSLKTALLPSRRAAFFNEAHLRCMENEVWLRHMKFDGITPKVCHALCFILASASTSWQRSCRFMFAGQTLHYYNINALL
ncbi:MAG: hypothetical protein UCK97_07510, partial [Acutalibacteraceae bacterium]|nr:hypothetical protein [Acutalibacteraceae bacterium]